jgi:hypothetical protein
LETRKAHSLRVADYSSMVSLSLKYVG